MSTKPRNKPRQIPILARHAVSLGIVFVLGLVLSFFIGHAIHRNIQLGKLDSNEPEIFEQGLAYVVTHARTSPSVSSGALDRLQGLDDTKRAADLLLAVAQSHSDVDDGEEPSIPKEVLSAVLPLMERMDAFQAIGLYDGLVQIDGIDAVKAAKLLLVALNPQDDAELLKVKELLDTRLLWSRQLVPTDLWLRWLGVLTQSNVELTQANTVRRLGDLPERVDDARVKEYLGVLGASQYERVRNMVLKVVAGYAAIAEDPTDYEQIIFDLGQDKNQHIARRAWMIVGHLKPQSGFAVNWRDAQPFVAEAMLWAAVKTNPENPKPAVSAMESGFQRIGWQALDQTESITYTELALDTDVASPVTQVFVDDPDFIASWRAILGSTRFAGDHEHWYVTLHSVYEDLPAPTWNEEQKQAARESFLNRYLAVTYRFNEYYSPKARELTEIEIALAELAAVEGWVLEPYRPNAFRLPNTPLARIITAASGLNQVDLDSLLAGFALDNSTVLDLFTLALTHADNQTIDRFIRSSHPEMTTMAAMASVIKGYEPTLIDGIDAAFIRNNPDLDIDAIRAMDDQALSALGLRRIDALPALYDAAKSAPPSANRSVEAKLLQLALWMRGDLGEQFDATAEAMMLDKDLPTSTVLLALLHRQRPAALEYLFGDYTTDRPNLNELFIQQRYWHVFHRFVDTSGLKIWLWGDPEAQAFQLEAMRQWYAVNRWKIERGWWPEPKADD